MHFGIYEKTVVEAKPKCGRVTFQGLLWTWILSLGLATPLGT